jgi:hypothetical protein
MPSRERKGEIKSPIFKFFCFYFFIILTYQYTISEHIYGTIKTLFFMIQIEMANRNDRHRKKKKREERKKRRWKLIMNYGSFFFSTTTATTATTTIVATYATSTTTTTTTTATTFTTTTTATTSTWITFTIDTSLQKKKEHFLTFQILTCQKIFDMAVLAHKNFLTCQLGMLEFSTC